MNCVCLLLAQESNNKVPHVFLIHQSIQQNFFLCQLSWQHACGAAFGPEWKETWDSRRPVCWGYYTLSLSTVGTPLSRQGCKRNEEWHFPRQPVDPDNLGITNGVGVLQHSVTSVTAWAPHGLWGCLQKGEWLLLDLIFWTKPLFTAIYLTSSPSPTIRCTIRRLSE